MRFFSWHLQHLHSTRESSNALMPLCSPSVMQVCRCHSKTAVATCTQHAPNCRPDSKCNLREAALQATATAAAAKITAAEARMESAQQLNLQNGTSSRSTFHRARTAHFLSCRFCLAGFSSFPYQASNSSLLTTPSLFTSISSNSFSVGDTATRSIVDFAASGEPST